MAEAGPQNQLERRKTRWRVKKRMRLETETKKRMEMSSMERTSLEMPSLVLMTSHPLLEAKKLAWFHFNALFSSKS